MKDRSVTTSIFIDKWHPKKDGKCAVTIRVTHERQKRYYPTEYALSPAEFAKVQGEKPRGLFKEISLELQAYEKRAAEIIEQMPLFSFEMFEKRYFLNTGSTDTLATAFELRINGYKEAGRIGSAYTYNCAKTSLNKFQPGLKFSSVTPGFLEKYEAWMLGEGKSKTTIGIYLRSLRSLFNEAISDGILTKDHYPFGKRKYEIPTSKNVKKALSLSEVGKLYNYVPEPDSPEFKAKDYWFFLYLCNGMNVKDMALLRYKNIQGDVLEFERAKTARTKRNAEPIRVMLNEDIKEIILRQGNKKRDLETFVFPILQKGLSPEREHDLIQLKVHVLNTHMRKIANKLGIEKDVTTYVARHSFATILKRSGASVEFIGEALGHGSTKTTQSYLAGFEDDFKREMAKALTAFNE